MNILVLSLLLIGFLYLYSLQFITSRYNNLVALLFTIYTIFTFVALMSIKDVYYFYLLYKLLNICSYMVIIKLSLNPNNFKSTIYYYFVGFVSSLLFITALYDITNSFLSIYLMNVSILLKLSIWPINNLLSEIYQKASISSYITISYVFNYIYTTLILLINLITVNYDTLYIYLVIGVIMLTTLLSVYYNFDKQTELKGFTAYSSISNVPLITSVFLLTSVISNYSIDYLISGIWMTIVYSLIYSTNILLLNLFSLFLEPVKGKK